MKILFLPILILVSNNLFAQTENPFPFIVDSLKAESLISIDSMIRPRNELLLVSNQFDTIYLDGKSQNQQVKKGMMKQDNFFSEEGPILFIDTTQSLAMQDEGYWALPPMLDSPELIEVADEIEEDLDLAIDIDSSELSLVEGIDYKEDSSGDTDLLAREPILPFQGVSKDDWENREINLVEAYPVFIYNNSDSVIDLTLQDGMISMVQEAQDEQGDWRPIEYWTFSWCGNSYSNLPVKPEFYALSKIYRYTGDFNTLLRLKMIINGETLYSNSIKGSINKSQFELVSFFNNRDKDFIEKRLLNK